jgi:hypothetical protein
MAIDAAEAVSRGAVAYGRLGRRQLLHRLSGPFPAHRLLEAAEPGTERPAHLGQALGPEQQQECHEKKGEVGRTVQKSQHRSSCSLALTALSTRAWRLRITARRVRITAERMRITAGRVRITAGRMRITAH